MSYKIIALIGQSGAGKDRMLKELLKSKRNFHEIISCTSRPPREGETDGINYHFLSNDEFASQLLEDAFMEATVFNNWAYGTRYQDLDEEKINIGVFNPDGIYNLLERKDIELKVYYLQVSDKTRLIRQLQRETEPDIEEIIRRYKTDKIDFADLDFKYEILFNETPSDFFMSLDFIEMAHFN